MEGWTLSFILRLADTTHALNTHCVVYLAIEVCKRVYISKGLRKICFQFYIVKENRGNEGTCVGVSRWPVHDFNHRTTADMWLYRAYSGNLYHNGEQTLTLSSYTQGDYITCVLDMEARTVSFGKNGEVRHSPIADT